MQKPLGDLSKVVEPYDIRAQLPAGNLDGGATMMPTPTFLDDLGENALNRPHTTQQLPGQSLQCRAAGLCPTETRLSQRTWVHNLLPIEMHVPSISLPIPSLFFFRFALQSTLNFSHPWAMCALYTYGPLPDPNQVDKSTSGHWVICSIHHRYPSMAT
jgi:hypothetical protein